MVNIGNFNLKNQCPQMYVYIFTIITSVLVALKYKTNKEIISTIISGIIMTIISMGVNYCDWTFQWLTWLMTSIYILIAIINIIMLICPKYIENDEKSNK